MALDFHGGDEGIALELFAAHFSSLYSQCQQDRRYNPKRREDLERASLSVYGLKSGAQIKSV